MRLPLFTLVSLFLTTTATAIEDLRVPGGVAVIPIESETRPTFNGKPVLTFRDNGQHVAVVGLALSLEPGEYMLQHMGKQIPFQVHPKKIPRTKNLSRKQKTRYAQHTRPRPNQRRITKTTWGSRRL